MLNELLEKLSAITAEAEAMLKAAATAADVENAKNKLTGRNGSLTALAPMMGKSPKRTSRPPERLSTKRKTQSRL